MTLHEYENQKDPQIQKAGSVILTPEQYTVTNETASGKYIKVEILGKVLRYATIRDGNILYTIDEKTGLKKSPSCFSIS